MEESGEMWGKLCTFETAIPYKDVRMRFLGNIEAKIDAKGRVFLPSAFRKVLLADQQEEIVMRKDVYQPCLVIYPNSIWNEQMDTLRSKLNRWDKTQQQVFRQFVSEVEAITLDNNGRMLIPKRLMQQVGIQQSVRFVGMGDTIEVWPTEQTEQAFMEQNVFGQALEELMKNEE